MPLVFCELALAYPPAKVSDPAQRIAAANGQFLLVEREAYRRLGGHASVAGKVLEDVELAFLAKRRKVGLRFRYADDAVSARMYRSTGGDDRGLDQESEAALRQRADAGVFWRALDFLLLFGLPVLAYELWNARLGAHGLEWLGAGWILALLWLRTLFRFYARVAKSNFPFLDCAHFAAGPAAVCGAALPKLVSAPDPEARKLEGAEIQPGWGSRALSRQGSDSDSMDAIASIRET